MSKETVTLSWENINVTLPEKKSFLTRKVTANEVPILRNVSGSVNPGTLLAIMGASGGGKTTLLNVLTSRVASDLTIEGSVKVNGLEIGTDITKMSAYVQQDDLFVGILTVREHLWFQAMLRMDEKIPKEERIKRIDEVILDLGLTKCKDSVIGIPDKVKSISGGERKRLSFASEILTNPALMFCDEPTSGLDSFMAENVVQTLRNMASKGKTILCTIHQPSSQIFNLFDNLLLLARGRVAYMGPTAKAAEFFSKQGLNCPANYNPADFFINSLAIVPGQETDSIEKIDKICRSFADSEGSRTLLKPNNSLEDASAKTKEFHVDYSKTSTFRTGFFNQFRYLTWRAFVVAFRDRNLFFARFGQTLMIALLAGLLYLRQSNDQKSIQNINGAIFLIIANSTFGNAFSVVSSFPLELPVFKREHKCGMYSTAVYFMTKTLADVPVFTFLPIVFSVIMYWMVGFKNDIGAFFIFVGTMVYITHVVVSYGYLISCAAGDVTIATALGGPLVVPFMLFGGLLLNDASVPVYFIWIQYLSWFKYGNEILVVNQWRNFGNIGCEYAVPATTMSPDQMAMMQQQQGGNPFFRSNSTNTVMPPMAASRCFKTGEEVLTSLNYSEDNYARDFGAMAGLLVGFRLIAFIALALRVNPLPSPGNIKSKNKVDSHPKNQPV